MTSEQVQVAEGIREMTLLIRVSAQTAQADTELSEQCTNISFIPLCSAAARAVLTRPPEEAESPKEPPAALEPSPHGLQHPLQILCAGEGFSQMEFITHCKAGAYLL